MKKLWPAALALALLLFASACRQDIPTADDPVVLPGVDLNGTQPPLPTNTPAPALFAEQAGEATPTPHTNYRRRWDEVGGIPAGVPQLAYGVSEVSFLNQSSVILRWSIINQAGIDSITAIVEDWVGRPMQYSAGEDGEGRPTRIWKNDNDDYFLKFTVFERDEPYFEDGSTLRAEMMISSLE